MMDSMNLYPTHPNQPNDQLDLARLRRKEQVWTYVGIHSTPVTPKNPTQIPLNTARGAPLPPSQVATDWAKLAASMVDPFLPQATSEQMIRIDMVPSWCQNAGGRMSGVLGRRGKRRWCGLTCRRQMERVRRVESFIPQRRRIAKAGNRGERQVSLCRPRGIGVG